MYASRSINVRAEPSVAAALAASLKRGAPVAILEKRGNWDRVEIPASPGAAQPVQGWVFNSYLTETDPGTATVSAPVAPAPSHASALPLENSASAPPPADPSPEPVPAAAASTSDAAPATP
jgi:SH3-like domain-containing protein